MKRRLRAWRYRRALDARRDAEHVEWALSLRTSGTVCYYVSSAATSRPEGKEPT